METRNSKKRKAGKDISSDSEDDDYEEESEESEPS